MQSLASNAQAAAAAQAAAVAGIPGHNVGPNRSKSSSFSSFILIFRVSFN